MDSKARDLEAATRRRPIQVLLMHGWGFDRSLWTPLANRLGGRIERPDRGYFGAAALGGPAAENPILAVGHSFGFAALLQDPPQGLAGLVAINGFACFTQRPDLPEGTPLRVLDRMVRRFADAPETVLAEFRRRCGLDEALPPGLDTGRLGRDLVRLRDDDARPALARLGAPLLVLAGGSDPIVPRALTQAQFGARPGGRIVWREGGGHLLPLSDPGWCADEIRGFAAGLP